MNRFSTAITFACLLVGNSLFAQNPREKWSTIPSDSLAILAVDLAAIRTQPELELLPWEVFGVASKEQMGVDLLSATSIEVAVGVPMPMPEIGIAISSKQPVDIADFVIPDLGAVEKSPKKPDLRFRQIRNQPVRMAQVDPNTVFLGTNATLNRMITGTSGKSKALDIAKESKEPVVVVIALERIRPVIIGFLNGEAGEQVPPDVLEPLKSLVENVSAIRLTSTVGLTSMLRLDLFGNSPESMKEIDQSMKKLREAAIAMIEQQVAQGMEQGPEMSPAMRKAIEAYKERVKVAVRNSQWTIDGDRLHVEVQAANSTATIGVLTGLLLPAVQSARDAARRMSSSNNLKQLGLAMHNYDSAYRRLPPRAITDKDGTPLLSWRVAILPFIEQAALYEQFHLDEPWDSEHNIKLIEKMPEVYASPRVRKEPGHSNYVMPYGEGLPGSEEKLRFANITDGTSNTIALVEVDTEYAVPWSAPEDFDVDEDSLLNAFPMNGQGTNVTFYDGSVKFLSQFIDEQILQAMLTHGGGEVLNSEGF